MTQIVIDRWNNQPDIVVKFPGNETIVCTIMKCQFKINCGFANPFIVTDLETNKIQIGSVFTSHIEYTTANIIKVKQSPSRYG